MPCERRGVYPSPTEVNQLRFESSLRVRLLALGFGVTLGLLLSEGLVRFVAPQQRTPLLTGTGLEGMTRLDARYGWILVPHTRGFFFRHTRVETNGLGLRDHD